MGANRAKQFLQLAERPVLAVTLESIHKCRHVDSVILVVPAADVDYCGKEIVKKYRFHKVGKVVQGGSRRQDSVRLGLEAIDGGCDLVLIHDGVRPLITTAEIDRIVSAAGKHGAVITGLQAKETVKAVNRDHMVTKTYNRSRVWLIQTPQVFPYKDILHAHRKALEEDWEEATDDAALVEKMGVPVKVLEGSEKNIKVTTPHDLELAGFLLTMGN